MSITFTTDCVRVQRLPDDDAVNVDPDSWVPEAIQRLTPLESRPMEDPACLACGVDFDLNSVWLHNHVRRYNGTRDGPPTGGWPTLYCTECSTRHKFKPTRIDHLIIKK